jgi:hypothetical protein
MSRLAEHVQRKGNNEISEESWIPNSKEAGKWEDQTFGGWMDGWMV